jgi:hypothetical protein
VKKAEREKQKAEDFIAIAIDRALLGECTCVEGRIGLCGRCMWDLQHDRPV